MVFRDSDFPRLTTPRPPLSSNQPTPPPKTRNAQRGGSSSAAALFGAWSCMKRTPINPARKECMRYLWSDKEGRVVMERWRWRGERRTGRSAARRGEEEQEKCEKECGSFQARKRNPNPNYLVRISSGGVGVFHAEGVGAKKFGMSFETQGNQTFWRDIPGFLAGISRRRPKSLRTKSSCSIFGPYPLTQHRKYERVRIACL